MKFFSAALLSLLANSGMTSALRGKISAVSGEGYDENGSSKQILQNFRTRFLAKGGDPEDGDEVVDDWEEETFTESIIEYDMHSAASAEPNSTVHNRPDDFSLSLEEGEGGRFLAVPDDSSLQVWTNDTEHYYERELHDLTDLEIQVIGAVTGEVCGLLCGVVAKCPPPPVGLACDQACGIGCGWLGDLTEAVLGFFQGCCHSDDAWVTVQTSRVDGWADGNALAITWHSHGGRTDPDSLGSIGKGESKTWREDLSASWLRAIELRVDDWNDICVTNFVFKVGPEPSNTGSEEVITLSAAMISYITGRPLRQDCLYFGDAEGAIGNFMFDWRSALTCFQRFKFYQSQDYARCFERTVIHYDVRRNGQYWRTTYSNPGNLPSYYVNPFIRMQNRLSGNLCMDLPASRTHNGNILQLYTCHGGASQQWDFDTEGRIRSKVNPRKCVEAGRSGVLYNKLFVYDCHDGNHQKWTRYTDGRIRNNQHGFYIGVAWCRNERGRQLELRHYEGGTCGTAQTWNW